MQNYWPHAIATAESPYPQNDTVLFFTFRSLKSLIEEGATFSWRLRPDRAANCTYGICVRSTAVHRAKDFDPYTAFLIFKVSGVAPTREEQDPLERRRYEVQFDEYAEINLAMAWGDRNPVHYGNMEELVFFSTDGKETAHTIDPSKLDWKKIPQKRTSKPDVEEEAKQEPVVEHNMWQAAIRELRQTKLELEEAAKIISGCGLPGVGSIYSKAAERVANTLKEHFE